MDEKILKMIEKKYPLSFCNTGSLGVFKVQGMKFVTTRYEAKGLGTVSVMKARGMAGLMKMTTLIVNPFYVDAPLISYDCIQVMGKNILYLEMFDTTLGGEFDISKLQEIEASGKAFTDHELGRHWYDDMRVGTPICKDAKGKCKKKLDELSLKYMEEYINACEKAAPCDENAKREKAKVYSEGLIKNGGPATDPVKKVLGEEATKEFFERVLFGTE